MDTREKMHSEPERIPTSPETVPAQPISDAKGTIVAILKKKNVQKYLLVGALLIVILIGAIASIRYAANNYMVPVRNAEKLENLESLDGKSFLKKSLKGLGVKNAREIINLCCESDLFLDMTEHIEETVEEYYEDNQDEYGDNFKIQYTVEEKVKLEKTDLRDYQKSFRAYMEDIQYIIEQTDDFDTDDWQDLAEELEMTRTQARKFIAALNNMVKDFGRLEVTAGYELDILRTITGEYLDEPEEEDITLEVVKVNGKWVLASNFRDTLAALLDF